MLSNMQLVAKHAKRTRLYRKHLRAFFQCLTDKTLLDKSIGLRGILIAFHLSTKLHQRDF